MGKITITIDDDTAICKMNIERDSKIVTKTVAVSDIVQAMSSMSVVKSPMLPRGALYYNNIIGRVSVGVVSLPHFGIISYGEDIDRQEIINMFIPGMLMHVDFFPDMKIKDIFLASFLDNSISLDTKLFFSPFGNVFTDYKICWGNVPLRGVTLSTADSLINKYVGSLFNGHIAVYAVGDTEKFNQYFGVKGIGSYSNYVKYIKKLAESDAETFPVDLFKKIGTVGSFVDKLSSRTGE